MKMLKEKIFSILWLLVAVSLTGCGSAVLTKSTPAIQPHESVHVLDVSVKSAEPVDPTCAYFYFLWGRHAELSKELDEALEAYEKALICDPQADRIIRKLPLLLIRMGRSEEAVDWLLRAIKKSPEEIGIRLLLAKVYVRLKKYEEAAEQYQSVLKINPKNETGALLLGELYARQKQYAKAEEIVGQLLDHTNTSYGASVFLARINVNQEKYKDAVKAYRNALDLNWSAELIFEMGELLTRLDRPEDAIDLYKQLIKKDEALEKAHIALVHTYIGMQRDDLALTELLKLKTIAEHPTRIELIISRIYAKQKKYDKAVTSLKGILEKNDSTEARYLLALVKVDGEKYSQALEQLQKIPDNASEYEDSLLLQVKIHRKLKERGLAISLLEKAVQKKESRTVDMFIVLASLQLSQGKGEEGKTVLRQALKLYPDDIDLLYEYALFLDQKGEQREAFQEMEHVINSDPNHSGALNYIGYTWADNNEHLDKALEYIQLAVSLKPENAFIRDSLGWVYYRLGEMDKAKVELEKALKLAGGDPNIYDHLGDVFRDLGKNEVAVEKYEKAIKLFRNDKERIATEEKLKALKVVNQQE